MGYLDDAADVIEAWLGWYSRHIELVTELDRISNTEVVVNRVLHPWGKRTVPAEKAAEIRQGLYLFEGAMAWGGDGIRADEAHYWIRRPPGDLLLTYFAQRLRAGYLND
jgi:hypothetical protein